MSAPQKTNPPPGSPSQSQPQPNPPTQTNPDTNPMTETDIALTTSLLPHKSRSKSKSKSQSKTTTDSHRGDDTKEEEEEEEEEDPSSARAMSHTGAWKPALDRRQSWDRQEYKHDVLARQYLAGEAGRGFSET